MVTAGTSSSDRLRARREFAVAAFLVLFGGAVLAAAGTIPPGVPTDPLGPRAFPLILGAGIVVCGLLLGAGRLLFGSQPARMGPLTDAEPGAEEDAGPFSASRLAGGGVATAAYLAAFEPLGYLLATPLYVGAIMLIHGRVGGRSLLLAPLLTTIALYSTFRFGLLIPVPLGVLEGILRW